MLMNEADIRWAASQQHACPNVRKGLRLLLRLMEAVNGQSDGWAYWPAPSKSAEKLIQLLQTAGNLQYGSHGTISDADLRKATTPIRAMVTRQRKRQARYGNTFEFDVDAALADPKERTETKRSVSREEQVEAEEQFCVYAKLLYRMGRDRAELYFLVNASTDEVDERDLIIGEQTDAAKT